MNEVQPLSPNTLQQSNPVPQGMITVFNGLITKYWNGSCSIFRVNEALGLIDLIANYPAEIVKENKWIEAVICLYENHGYIVSQFDTLGGECLEFKKA